MHSKDQIETLLATNGLNVPLHTDWKIELDDGKKAPHIRKWLDNHKIADYMIIDDEESGDEFTKIEYIEKMNLNKNKIILLSPEDGVSMADFFKMKAIVANWD